MAASNHVFDTVKLLIPLSSLKQFSMSFRPKISSSHRVNKQWKAVIDNSSKLQWALFLRPIPGNPLSWNSPYASGSGQQSISGHVLKNPLLEPLFDALHSFEMIDGFPSVEQSLCEYSRSLSNRASWKNPCASWRRMLASQPPVESCFFVEFRGYWRDIIDVIPQGVFEVGETLAELEHKMRSSRRYLSWFVVKVPQSGSFDAGQYLEVSSQLETLIAYRNREAQPQSALQNIGHELSVTGSGNEEGSELESNESDDSDREASEAGGGTS